MGTRTRGESIATWCTCTVMVLGWIGVTVTVLDTVPNRFLNYCIAMQFSACALGAMFTAVSLTMASLARAGYEVTESLCRIVQGAIEDQAHVGREHSFGTIGAPPLAYRILAHPATWRGAGGAALSAEAVCVTQIALAARHVNLFPIAHQYTLAAIITGIAATCGAICVSGARQQRVVVAMRTAGEVDRQLKELLQPAYAPTVLRAVPLQEDRAVGGKRHHLRRTAGD